MRTAFLEIGNETSHRPLAADAKFWVQFGVQTVDAIKIVLTRAPLLAELFAESIDAPIAGFVRLEVR